MSFTYSRVSLCFWWFLLVLTRYPATIKLAFITAIFSDSFLQIRQHRLFPSTQLSHNIDLDGFLQLLVVASSSSSGNLPSNLITSLSSSEPVFVTNYHRALLKSLFITSWEHTTSPNLRQKNAKMCQYEYFSYDTCGHSVIECREVCPKSLWRAGVSGVMIHCVPDILGSSTSWPGPKEHEPPQVTQFQGFTGFCNVCVMELKASHFVPIHGQQLLTRRCRFKTTFVRGWRVRTTPRTRISTIPRMMRLVSKSTRF